MSRKILLCDTTSIASRLVVERGEYTFKTTVYDIKNGNFMILCHLIVENKDYLLICDDFRDINQLGDIISKSLCRIPLELPLKVGSYARLDIIDCYNSLTY